MPAGMQKAVWSVWQLQFWSCELTHYLIYGWKPLQRYTDDWSLTWTPDQASVLLICHLPFPVQLLMRLHAW